MKSARDSADSNRQEILTAFVHLHARLQALDSAVELREEATGFIARLPGIARVMYREDPTGASTHAECIAVTNEGSRDGQRFEEIPVTGRADCFGAYHIVFSEQADVADTRLSVQSVADILALHLESVTRTVSGESRRASESNAHPEASSGFGREIALHLLSLLNKPNGKHDLMAEVTQLMREWSGCSAVGIRLSDGDDFPYFETRGFPSQFVAAERRLCEIDPAGEVLKDESGRPVLECMCGNVIRCRTNPALPFFTEFGSFWTNCTSDLLASTSEEDRQARTRNRCNGEGYESVALIPIRRGDDTYGLLQFNDKKRDRFNTETIEMLERLAANLAIGLSERNIQEKLRKQEITYHRYLSNISEVIAVVDSSLTVRYESPNVTRQFGWTAAELIGKSWLQTTHPEDGVYVGSSLFDLMGRADGERESIQFRYLCKDGSCRIVEATAVALLRDPYVSGLLVSYRDISKRRSAEDALERSERKFSLAFHSAPVMMTISSLDDGRYLEVNDAFVSASGYSRDTVIGHTSTEIGFIDAEVRESLRKTLTSDGVIRNLELELYRADGAKMICLYSGEIIEIEGKRRLLSIASDISEQKKNEEALRQSEARFRDMADLLPQAIWESDSRGRFTYINHAGFETFGYDAESPDFALSVWDVIAPEELEKARANFGRHFHDKERVGNHEYICITSDGRRFPALIFSTPIRRDDEVVGVRGITLDMTEQHRLKQDYQTLFDKMLDGCALHEIICDANGKPVDYRFLAINPSFARMTGLGPEIIGRTVREVIPDVEEYWIDTYGGVALTGKPVHFENESLVLRKQFEVTAFRNAPNQFASVFTDVTERKAAEAERERLRMAIDQAAEIVLITETDGTIRYVNPAFERITGYSRDEVLGGNPRMLKSGEHDELFYRDMWQSLTAGKVWKGRIINRKKDGSLYTEEAVISPVHDQSGKIVNYVGVKRDITIELTLEEQLRQAQKMEAIGRLAGGIAHDFNNLLQVIMGFSEMVLDAIPQQDENHDAVDQVYQAGSRARALVKQLLAFSRQEVLHIEALDLNDVVGNMMKMLRRVIGEHISLEFHPGELPGTIHADPGHVSQILTNLCVNARDAVTEGGIIKVWTSFVEFSEDDVIQHAWARSGRFIQLNVEDNGRGISAEMQKKIFEPFFTTKRVGEGTGLGLSTVYGLVDQHDGFIRVYSELSKGSTFSVHFPAFPIEDLSRELISSHSTERGTETILLAEDEEMVRNLVRKILEDAGYTVITARDGNEALQVFSERGSEIDLFMLDVVMPNTGGRVVYETIRLTRPDMKVLFASGYNSDSRHADFFIHEGLPLIQKPVRRNELLRKVRDVLDSPVS